MRLRASDAPHGAYLDDCCHRCGAILPSAKYASLFLKEKALSVKRKGL